MLGWLLSFFKVSSREVVLSIFLFFPLPPPPASRNLFEALRVLGCGSASMPSSSNTWFIRSSWGTIFLIDFCSISLTGLIIMTACLSTSSGKRLGLIASGSSTPKQGHRSVLILHEIALGTSSNEGHSLER